MPHYRTTIESRDIFIFDREAESAEEAREAVADGDWGEPVHSDMEVYDLEELRRIDFGAHEVFKDD